VQKRILRHRLLEDSLVLAEQQGEPTGMRQVIDFRADRHSVGLPWRWAMKDIDSPDPWAKVTCHSFTSTMLSCQDSQDILLVVCGSLS